MLKFSHFVSLVGGEDLNGNREATGGESGDPEAAPLEPPAVPMVAG